MQKVAFRTKIRLTIKYLNKIFKYKIDKYAGCYILPSLKKLRPRNIIRRRYIVTTIKAYSTQKKFEIRSSPQRARESKSGCVRSMYSLDSQEQSLGFEDH